MAAWGQNLKGGTVAFVLNQEGGTVLGGCFCLGRVERLAEAGIGWAEWLGQGNVPKLHNNSALHNHSLSS